LKVQIFVIKCLYLGFESSLKSQTNFVWKELKEEIIEQNFSSEKYFEWNLE